MKQVYQTKVVENRKISPDIYKMTIMSKEIAESARAGQFVNVYCKNPGSLLARPISISQINKKENTIVLIYGVVGKGTKSLSNLKRDEKIEILGPLGNGFKIPEEDLNHIVIGGGIGVPPLVELVKELKGNIEVFLGFRDTPILVEEFERYGAKVYMATEDGSQGVKGNVMDIIKEKKVEGDLIYSCGPRPMLRTVSKWAGEKGIKAQVSMEERMACGVGACVGCVCKVKGEKGVENKRVCKDGPVFWGDEVIWDE